ncbi:hypothetical protein ACRRTK_017895 [Alexandromys fortis]
MADRKCRSASPPWTCKYPEGQNANLEKIPWNTSATVAFVGSCPKCPQGVYLTSSSMEPQGSVPHLSQSPEASCEFMENPRGWGEAAAKENLVCIQENPGTTVLTQMELEMKELKSALSEVHAQEHLVKKDLEALKQLYRGELESIDGMSLELCM